jgi:AraC-like DNA-binding protein
MECQPPTHLLDAFPLIRARTVKEASEQIGRIFSPHRLELRGADSLDVRHNQVRMRDVSLNVLSYGADVLIDPGERGDFYMLQLPLAGNALLASGGDEVRVDSQMLSVLQPRMRSRMWWSGDCSMILVQVPRSVVEHRASEWGAGATPRFALARPRHEPEVAAWWQAVLDLTRNLDRFGQQWLRHPAAYAAMEEFLLSAFTSMLREPAPEGAVQRGDERCLRRAKEYVHAHLDRALTLAEIARHACVSPRTLETVFKRHGEVSPLAYARRQRLQAVHELLRSARRDGRPANVTELAMGHGFLHMGRFAAQYREHFGCAPSETLRPH